MFKILANLIEQNNVLCQFWNVCAHSNIQLINKYVIWISMAYSLFTVCQNNKNILINEKKSDKISYKTIKLKISTKWQWRRLAQRVIELKLTTFNGGQAAILCMLTVGRCQFTVTTTFYKSQREFNNNNKHHVNDALIIMSAINM